MLVETVDELSAQLGGIEFEFINMGGGIGIPYRLGQQAVNLQALAGELRPILTGRKEKLFMECGRMITGPYGFLVSRVLHRKSTYRNYLGVDACMANLMRPGMYGAYHHITVLGKEDFDPSCATPGLEPNVYDVVGSLCENNDKFAIDRELPPVEIGDLVVLHDAGAHGHAMGFNYNGKLRSAEFLLKEDGSFQLVRRAETLEDCFATLQL